MKTRNIIFGLFALALVASIFAFNRTEQSYETPMAIYNESDNVESAVGHTANS